MRKNKMMRLASMLLVLCLLTTSVISGTFAKYITTDQYEDTARVAKFGVVATVSGDLFGSTYAKADKNIISYETKGGSVSSMAKDDKTADSFVVAPGTENLEGLTLSVTGTPEVATKVYFDAAEAIAADDNGAAFVDSDIYLNAGTYGVMVEYKGVLTAENYSEYYVLEAGKYRHPTQKEFNNRVENSLVFFELHDTVAVGADGYYPLTWYLNGEAKESQKAVKTELTGTFNEKEFAPNESNALNATVGWSWSYGKAREEKAENITVVDKQDTILGNMMASSFVALGTADPDADVKVVRMSDTNDSWYYEVTYKEVDAAKGSANKVVMAYTKDNKAQNPVACLTVAFNARLTVEQVD